MDRRALQGYMEDVFTEMHKLGWAKDYEGMGALLLRDLGPEMRDRGLDPQAILPDSVDDAPAEAYVKVGLLRAASPVRGNIPEWPKVLADLRTQVSVRRLRGLL